MGSAKKDQSGPCAAGEDSDRLTPDEIKELRENKRALTEHARRVFRERADRLSQSEIDNLREHGRQLSEYARQAFAKDRPQIPRKKQ